MVRCQVAELVWDKIQELVNRCFSLIPSQQQITFSSDTIMFQNLSIVKDKNNRQAIREIIYIAKHVLYRCRFRENRHNMLRIKVVLINISFEIDKLISTRVFANKRIALLNDFVGLLKDFLGLNNT